MALTQTYDLPKLGDDDNALTPVISDDLLRPHHEKHHAAYVHGANTILQRIALADQVDFDIQTARNSSEEFVSILKLRAGSF